MGLGFELELGLGLGLELVRVGVRGTFFSGSASRHMESARDQPTASTELLLLPPLELLPMWQMAVSSVVSGLRHCLRHSPLEKFQNLSVPSCAPEISLRLVPSKASVVIAWSPCASLNLPV